MTDNENQQLNREQEAARTTSGRFGFSAAKRAAENSVAANLTWDAAELPADEFKSPQDQGPFPHASPPPEQAAQKAADVAALELGTERYLTNREHFKSLDQAGITALYVSARREFATRPKTDKTAVEQFYNLRYSIAQHPKTAPEILDRLIDDHIELDPKFKSPDGLSYITMSHVAEHPNSTVAMMERLKWQSPELYVANLAEDARIEKPEYKPTLLERFEQTDFMSDAFMGIAADGRMLMGRPWTRLGAKIKQVAGQARSLN